MITTTGPTGPTWRCAPFGALTVHQLDTLYRARQQVFIIEQQCIYLDADGCDRAALHLVAWADLDAQALLAYARILPPGVKYPEPSIGRVLTLGPARGTGLGRELVQRALVACQQAHPGHGIRISAQARLQGFYAGFGFMGVGEPYDEDGIPHLEMLRSRPPLA